MLSNLQGYGFRIVEHVKSHVFGMISLVWQTGLQGLMRVPLDDESEDDQFCQPKL